MSANQYLRFRHNNWHYKRRVPARYAMFDDRDTIRFSLRTDSLDVARIRRDAQVQADDLYWSTLIGIDGEPTKLGAQKKRELADKRYQAATLRATARGFTYASADDLAEHANVKDIIERLRAVDEKARDEPSALEQNEAEALLGGLQPSPVKVSEAFEIYCNEIAIDELFSKSDTQKKLWRKTKQRAISYFIEIVDDLPITDVSREHALKFYNWWKDRLIPQSGEKTLSPNTANRDLGNLRVLFRAYFRHLGDDERPNPFRNLAFRTKKSTGEVPPFENNWVREHILAPGVFAGINRQAYHIVYALIETGCRPGEIGNLMEEDICLDADIPHILIRPKKNREIKTASSIREIPLVGIALEAMKQFPQGFPHYRDKPDLLSASLMKAFKTRGLFPTDRHRIYSFRHSFEKRMLEAGVDHDLRLTLMGHMNKRPAYGDGGSLAFRREELLKIVHPYQAGMLSG